MTITITIPGDADVFPEVIDRIGFSDPTGRGYIVEIDPVEGHRTPPTRIECRCFDPDTGGIRGYRVDEDCERIGHLEVFVGVTKIAVL
jgi:hypothetical protein